MGGFVVSTNSTKCLIQPDQSFTKSWNNRPSPLPKPESLLLSMQEQVSLHLPTQLEVNIIPIFLSRRTLIILPRFSPDSILSILFSTRLTRFLIGDWRRILLGCILKIVLKMPLLKISLYLPSQ